jgi:hypothetical protein
MVCKGLGAGVLSVCALVLLIENETASTRGKNNFLNTFIRYSFKIKDCKFKLLFDNEGKAADECDIKQPFH